MIKPQASLFPFFALLPHFSLENRQCIDLWRNQRWEKRRKSGKGAGRLDFKEERTEKKNDHGGGERKETTRNGKFESGTHRSCEMTECDTKLPGKQKLTFKR